MSFILEHSTSYWGLFVLCVSCGILLPFPEDLPLIYAGMQIETGQLGLLATVGTVIPAILFRDALCFGVGVAVGQTALRRGPLVRLLGPDRIQRARDLVGRRAGRAILLARFSVGFRTAVFLSAGALGVRARHFLAWDLVGLALTVPAWLALGWVMGDPILSAFTWSLEHRGLALAALGAGVLTYLAWRLHRRRATAPDAGS